MICPRCGGSTRGQICEYCGTPLSGERNSKNNDFQRYTERSTEEIPSGDFHTSDYGTPMISERSRGTTLLICIFYGWLGIHNFYCKRIGWGIAYLLTAGLFGVGWLIDIVRIALGIYRDSEGLELKDWTIYPKDRTILIILAVILVVRLIR